MSFGIGNIPPKADFSKEYNEMTRVRESKCLGEEKHEAKAQINFMFLKRVGRVRKKAQIIITMLVACF